MRTYSCQAMPGSEPTELTRTLSAAAAAVCGASAHLDLLDAVVAYITHHVLVLRVRVKRLNRRLHVGLAHELLGREHSRSKQGSTTGDNARAGMYPTSIMEWPSFPMLTAQARTSEKYLFTKLIICSKCRREEAVRLSRSIVATQVSSVAI